jgi:hypothetical protein
MQRPTRKVTDPPSLLQAFGSFANFMISTLVALTALLEATEKELPEEKAARFAVDQSLAEAKAAWQIADKARQSFEEENC